mmetsp:Transcript_13180/g.22179  ORF Transcript_13180/g.22179 Transcript_13180/m.22179 type:complete len:86 (-) Transcript_13180:364-621(-)
MSGVAHTSSDFASPLSTPLHSSPLQFSSSDVVRFHTTPPLTSPSLPSSYYTFLGWRLGQTPRPRKFTSPHRNPPSSWICLEAYHR